jgi:GT2 family glycosyltransferase
MISIVTVYNDEKILNECLLKSLKDQTVEYKLIIVDNTKGRFKSASEAHNYGGNMAKGEYIMFVHQDVDLCSKSWLEDIEDVIEDLPNLGIAGVAGVSETTRGVITNIKHGATKKLVGKNQIDKPTKVQTVDECLIIIPKSVFGILQFDEQVCDGWHLYAVDYCLSIKMLGFDAYVIPTVVYHKSPGYSFSKTYYLTLDKIITKHKRYYKKVYTTMGNWSTAYPLKLQKSLHLRKTQVSMLIEKIRGTRLRKWLKRDK